MPLAPPPLSSPQNPNLTKTLGANFPKPSILRLPMAPPLLRAKMSRHSRALTLTLTSPRPFSSSPPFPDPNPNPDTNPTSDSEIRNPRFPSSQGSSFFSDIKERLRTPQPNPDNRNPQSPPPPNPDNRNPQSAPPPPHTSSLFSDIKERLRTAQQAPRRIPRDPLPPPAAANSAPDISLDQVRKSLAEFRRNAGPTAGSPSGPSQHRPISFQELYKSPNAFKDNRAQDSGVQPNRTLSFDAIRESLRKISPLDPQRFPGLQRQPPAAPAGPSLIGDQESLPKSIFEKEINERKGEKEGEGEALKTEFVRSYTHDELGEKLRSLRPEAAKKQGKNWFSLEELNHRLAKLRELEENQSIAGFRELRKSLMKMKANENSKNANMPRMPFMSNLVETTKSYLDKPPQENLLENYFHPDHMSSAEKMKLELKKVRDEFKMSESDCGSGRVQIAQLTTKIKHLSAVLHKKDKHSRKGLNEMVQRRKKLLKYLRRTDWDSYCFVLSKLGLRDVPEYKVPDYKT